MDGDQDWKKSVGFPINYNTESSDDDFGDVVMRRPRQTELLLEDGGDGAEADLLGTTPPRMRIRDKKKRRVFMDSAVLRDGTRRSTDDIVVQDQGLLDRPKNRLSLKIQRARERDRKQDMGQHNKADSLPSPNPTAAVPTLVESCSRFMSLTSRLKCRESQPPEEEEEVERRVVGKCTEDHEFPPSRVNFHKTFSMLINMGNIDKGCRRTISREEQVWQNELKDLIWLEIQAKIAGRTLAEQDAFLCAQRNIVPTIVQNIRNYRFVNPNPCRSHRRLGVINDDQQNDSGTELDGETGPGCVSLDCRQCAGAVGGALREVGALLDAVHGAAALYPSSHALVAAHPLVRTTLFQNRIKAMCLWYNTALHMRLKMVALRRMVFTMKMKQRRRFQHLPSTDSEVSRQSMETRPCQVRFNVSATPTDSSNSEASHSEAKEIEGKSDKEEVTEDDGLPTAEVESDKEGVKARQKTESELREENETEIEEKRDEVDSCSDKKHDQSAPPTPEIVISDSKYGTSDTTTSNESGYTSNSSYGTDSYIGKMTEDVFELGSLDDLTGLKLLNKCKVSIFRIHHFEMLKTQGVRRCMLFMNKMRSVLLHKVYHTLEKHDGTKPTSTTNEETAEVFDDTKEEEFKTEAQDEDKQKTYELRRYGCWSEECLSMRLPSYRNHFLLLSSICMEATHDYLSLRLEDRPQNPSCLTVKQLIHELKEGLDIATEMRTAFARNIEVALAGHSASEAARQDLLLIVRTYDQTVETVFKQYLSYLRTMSEVEAMGRARLQSEWSFTARLAKRTKCAALLAPVTFSEIVCNQLNRIQKQFQYKFEQLGEELGKNASDSNRHFVYGLCRAVQQVYASERDATLQAAQWARALAARLALAPRPAYTPQRAAIFESLISIRHLIVHQTNQTLDEWRANEDSLTDGHEAIGARLRELMLQIYRLGFELHKELYKFAQAPFKLEQEKNRRHRPASLQPVRRSNSNVGVRRKRPETMMVHETSNLMIHKELHRFVVESTRPSQTNRRSVTASPPRVKFLRSDSVGEDAETNVFDDINTFTEGQTQTSIELLLTGEQPQSEENVQLRTESSRISCEEKQWATRVARAVVEFAKCWMQFVIERCDTGRGLRPRWASQGLEFLMLACDPCNTKHLTEEEFEDLKKKMDGCISHVIGSRPHDNNGSTPEHAHRRRPRLHSPLPGAGGNSTGRIAPAPPTPPCEPDPLLSFPVIDSAAHSMRVLEAIKQVDEARDEKLRAMQSVGHVVEAAVASYEPKLRQLKFKWQRGLKIGAGTFGKVYTVVNTESGQLLAMKELNIGAGDRRALQRAANELRVLEGVIHPHLVRYYGCELHREEMLIFMELCVEGSLEALVATSGALAEHTTRRYTKQLLSAVGELHARGIAHRDIKSGNIFLTNEGHCLKLGDFGCAVKIRANTTAAGELIGHVGTQAYMAPEVFMKSTGHGRAADIWSLGCVVTEMASGKRPFAEYDSNVQIMFVVGMGGRPGEPDALSAEGQRFCRACLTHEPEQRPTAEALSLHHFLKLESDDDCKCEPAFLMT